MLVFWQLFTLFAIQTATWTTDALDQREKRQIRTDNPSWKWPDGKVYYLKDKTIYGPTHIALNKAIKMWEACTCVRFKRIYHVRNRQSWIRITVSDRFAAFVGKQKGESIVEIKYTKQDDSLKGRIAHELGHVLGLLHTQSRVDRDRYITVNMSNLPKSAHDGYAIKNYNTSTFNVPFDFGSIMMYGPRTISKSQFDSITPKDGKLYRGTMGQRTELTLNDCQIINKFYCSDKCGNKEVECQNQGLQNPNRCSSCLCPGGLGGKYCSKAAPYKRYVCSKNIQLSNVYTSVEITSPRYPSPPVLGTSCSYYITAPEGLTVAATIDELQLACSSSITCQDFVEIKTDSYDLSTTGSRFCCSRSYNNPIIPSVVHSTGAKMVVRFETRSMYFRGMKFKLTLVANGPWNSKSNPGFNLSNNVGSIKIYDPDMSRRKCEYYCSKSSLIKCKGFSMAYNKQCLLHAFTPYDCGTDESCTRNGDKELDKFNDHFQMLTDSQTNDSKQSRTCRFRSIVSGKSHKTKKLAVSDVRYAVVQNPAKNWRNARFNLPDNFHNSAFGDQCQLICQLFKSFHCSTYVYAGSTCFLFNFRIIYPLFIGSRIKLRVKGGSTVSVEAGNHALQDVKTIDFRQDSGVDVAVGTMKSSIC